MPKKSSLKTLEALDPTLYRPVGVKIAAMIITDRKKLEEFCNTLKRGPFLSIDTEFLRDKTYYPQLCLIQMAAPGIDAAAVDPLAEGMDLAPVFELLADESVVKVFHAALEDLEIFYYLTGRIPHPIFDTQVAAMVCGYGNQIGYSNLVHGICGKKLDKGVQFTDWSRRPLSAKQITYALDDVIFLRDIYLKLKEDMDRKGRVTWVEQEMDVLTAPKTYENHPEEAWQRIKARTDKPKVLAVLRELAAWRESEAQRRDIPRSWMIRDETLVDMAVHAPRNEKELCQIRNISQDMAKGRTGKALLEAVQRGLDTPMDRSPRAKRRERFLSELTPVLEMLKMLLRIQCATHGVAAKLVASSDDLEMLAMDSAADIPAMKGWRYEVFGKEARELMEGRIGLSLKNGKIEKNHIR